MFVLWRTMPLILKNTLETDQNTFKHCTLIASILKRKNKIILLLLFFFSIVFISSFLVFTRHYHVQCSLFIVEGNFHPTSVCDHLFSSALLIPFYLMLFFRFFCLVNYCQYQIWLMVLTKHLDIYNTLKRFFIASIIWVLSQTKQYV